MPSPLTRAQVGFALIPAATPSPVPHTCFEGGPAETRTGHLNLRSDYPPPCFGPARFCGMTARRTACRNSRIRDRNRNAGSNPNRATHRLGCHRLTSLPHCMETLSSQCPDSPWPGSQTGLELNTRCLGETLPPTSTSSPSLLQVADALAKAYQDSQQYGRTRAGWPRKRPASDDDSV